MKTKFFFFSLFLVVSFVASSQTKPVRIVFDVTSKDTLTQQAALRHVSLMAKSYPDAKLEIVVYGGALPMFVRGKSTIAKGMENIVGNKNLAFKVCGVTMKRDNVDKSQLLPGVEVVADAIIEIVNKQGEGWGYIKEAQ